MRATATQYAQALYEATKDKSPKEIDGVLANFVKTLSRNNQTKLAGSIENKFEEIYNQENGIVEAEIITCEKVSSEVSSKVRTWICTKYKAREAIIKNIVDKSIKGGVIIKIGDEVMDGSVGRKLRDLKIFLEK